MYDIFKCSKAAVYHNTARLTPAEIKDQTGCTHIINGYLFDNDPDSDTYMAPCAWLVIGGKVLSCDQYGDYGFACGATGAPVMSTDRTQSFLSGVPILKDGKRLYRNLTPDVARSAERTAVGWFPNGRVMLWCSTEKMTRLQLQEKLLSFGVSDALMLDGGGSTQGDFPASKVISSRPVATLLLFWAEESEKSKDPEEETTMFKLALGAGHGINTSGKRCLKALDPNETREWWLNDRICDMVESNLEDYEGYSLMRLDDSDDGEENVPLAGRVSRANSWGADLYLSVHHNAGANGTSAGGIVVYTHPNCSKESEEWSNALYKHLIAKTGLKGNRTDPQAKSDLYVLRKTTMPAVLLELGFMDSKTDVPVILTEDYAQKCAKAITEVIVERGKLTKKKTTAATDDTMYKVQLGAFSQKANAEKLSEELKEKGYQTYITKV